MAVTAQQVKELRDRTGARMMDCQQALKESGGNVDEAVAWLRKKNMAQADKAAGKDAEEGLIGIKAEGDALVAVQLSANTDFAAKNDEYKKLLNELVDLAYARKTRSPEELNAKELHGQPVQEYVKEIAGKVGENIAIKQVHLAEGAFGHYLHHDHKQAAIVELEGLAGEEAKQFGKTIAMHIVSAKPVPICLDRSGVPADQVKKEKEIVLERLKNDPKNSKKPAEILEKIVEGQMGKFYSEKCLLEQPFVMENKKSVQEVVQEKGKDVKIKRYVYLKV